jgi:glycine/D-amino acid oxidase-like deaminating enzyme
MTDIIVIGAGPAGVLAALCAAELGAHTALVASGEFRGMTANDGPVPVRVLAHTARLLRNARQLVSTASWWAIRCWIVRGCLRAWARSSMTCAPILSCVTKIDACGEELSGSKIGPL